MNELIYNLVNCKRIIDVSRLKIEVFIVLYFCNGTLKGNVDYDCIGTKDHVAFPDTNLVINNCKKLNCNSIILLHNHPYYRSFDTLFYKFCDPEPSLKDIASTLAFSKIMKSNNINILDHIIVCPNSHFSFADNDLL